MKTQIKDSLSELPQVVVSLLRNLVLAQCRLLPSVCQSSTYLPDSLPCTGLPALPQSVSSSLYPPTEFPLLNSLEMMKS